MLELSRPRRQLAPERIWAAQERDMARPWHLHDSRLGECRLQRAMCPRVSERVALAGKEQRRERDAPYLGAHIVGKLGAEMSDDAGDSKPPDVGAHRRALLTPVGGELAQQGGRD